MKRPIPIGISDFKKIIEGGYAYVDKTLFIQELIERGHEVAVIPRPRRFGKTLNISMLRYFFEKSEEDTSYLFKNLQIWEHEKYRDMQGQFPVIFISLKGVKLPSWQDAFKALRALVAMEFERHCYLLEGEILTLAEKSNYLRIVNEESDLVLLQNSLTLLTKWMYRYHKKKIILLIDEYDTPAHAAFIGNYYVQLIDFIRNWLSEGLKDNIYLERGVLTGILRIAKESIFSGLNNAKVYSLFNNVFQDKFGLLESEVVKLLEEYELSNNLPSIREWYDGYRIGSCEGVYNPWSVLSCIDEQGKLGSYWTNTSDNALMKQLIIQGSGEIKADIEELLRGGIIEINIEEGVVFSELSKSPNAVWALLLFTGYLSLDASPSYDRPSRLRIPNLEVSNLYQTMIFSWFETTIHLSKYHALLNSLTSGDIHTFSIIFQKFLLSSVSFFDLAPDEPEKIYHAFVLGMLFGLKDRYEVISNRESGYGRYDVMLIPRNPDELGIIMEFKKSESFEKEDLETAVAAAIKQIEDKHYAQVLHDRGIERILLLGLAFKGKEVLIRSKSHNF